MEFFKKKKKLIDYDPKELDLELLSQLQVSLVAKLLLVNNELIMRYQNIVALSEDLPNTENSRAMLRELANYLERFNTILNSVLNSDIPAYMLTERLEMMQTLRKKITPPEVIAALDRTHELVGDYGQALEETAATRSIVIDASRLPAPKEKIKAAILLLLETYKDSRMAERLKVCFMGLARFQPNVGDEVISLGPSEVPDPKDTQAIRQLAEVILQQAPRYQYWLRIVSEEQNRLVEELKSAGHLKAATKE